MDEETKKLFYILTKAMNLERQGYLSFKKATEKVKSVKAKELFLRLSKAEIRHEKVIREEYDALLEKTNIPPESEIKDIADIEEPVWAQRLAAFSDWQIEEDAGDLEIIKKAIKAEEEEACQFFTQLAEFTNNSREKGLYTELAAEESKNKLLLEAEYEQITGTGYFFDSKEFSVEY